MVPKKISKFVMIVAVFVSIIHRANVLDKSASSMDKFYACYTKIDSGETFEKYSRTGPYADIAVDLRYGKLVFWRGSSYLPYWETQKTSGLLTRSLVAAVIVPVNGLTRSTRIHVYF